MNMNSRKKRFAAILLTGITFICTSGITHVQVKADPVQEENVEEKIQQMSLAEKIAQLFFITPETLAGMQSAQEIQQEEPMRLIRWEE